MPGEGTYNKANDNLSGFEPAGTGNLSRKRRLFGESMTPNADIRLQEINSTNIGNLDSLFQQDPQMWQTWSDLKQEMATAEQAGQPYPLDFLPYILENILGGASEWMRRSALQGEREAAGVAGHDYNVPSLSDEVGPAEVTDEANSDLSLEGLVKRLFGKTKSFR